MESQDKISNPDLAWTDMQLRMKALDLALKAPGSLRANIDAATAYFNFIKNGELPSAPTMKTQFT